VAVIKVKFYKDATRRLSYVFRQRAKGDPADGSNTIPEEEAAKQSFKSLRELHGVKEGEKKVFEIFQSWHPDESKRLTSEEVNKMGMELAEKYFPGHQYVVVTHSNKAHLHNHILVNVVHPETGRRIKNKYEHLHKLRKINDEICQSRGLSIPNQAKKNREDRTPEHVQRMRRFKGHSWVLDMMEKADFARKYATSYDEYRAILMEFGIGVRVEKKNITYIYPGDKERKKRGDNMGRKYDKSALEEIFQKNDELFRTEPGRRHPLQTEIESLKNSHGETLKLPKDYGAFTKVKRGEKISYPSDELLKDSIIPIDEIRRARNSSILEYCAKNKIKLLTNDKGQTVLKGREYVIIGEKEWINGKNNTRGTLIEFVAAHHNLSFLRAISKINGNPKLLLLEEKFGEKKRGYTSFYIPNQQKMDGPSSIERLGRLLESHGIRKDTSRALLDNGRAQVRKDGMIRIFGGDDDSGAVEFTEDKGKWKKSLIGQPSKPLFSAPAKGRKAIVYTDPLSFLKQHGEAVFVDRKKRDGILALLTPDAEQVDRFVGHNPSVDTLLIVSSPSHPVELDFFSNLKTRYKKYGVNVESVSLDVARTHGLKLGI